MQLTGKLNHLTAYSVFQEIMEWIKTLLSIAPRRVLIPQTPLNIMRDYVIICNWPEHAFPSTASREISIIQGKQNETGKYRKTPFSLVCWRDLRWHPQVAEQKHCFSAKRQIYSSRSSQIKLLNEGNERSTGFGSTLYVLLFCMYRLHGNVSQTWLEFCYRCSKWAANILFYLFFLNCIYTLIRKESIYQYFVSFKSL